MYLCYLLSSHHLKLLPELIAFQSTNHYTFASSDCGSMVQALLDLIQAPFEEHFVSSVFRKELLITHLSCSASPVNATLGDPALELKLGSETTNSSATTAISDLKVRHLDCSMHEYGGSWCCETSSVCVAEPVDSFCVLLYTAVLMNRFRKF